MIAGHHSLVARVGTVLPYDAEVEYIYSSRVQYLDTGVPMHQITHFAIQFEPLTGGSAYDGFFGGDYQQNILAYANSSQTAVTTRGLGLGSIAYGSITINKTACSVPNLDTTFVVFAAKNSTPPRVPDSTRGKMRLTTLQLWTGANTLAFNGFAVRKKGVGYLYDRVSGGLFGNADTRAGFNAALGIGPDKTT